MCVFIHFQRGSLFLYDGIYSGGYGTDLCVCVLLRSGIGYGIGLCVYIYVRASRSTTLSSNNVRNFQKTRNLKKKKTAIQVKEGKRNKNDLLCDACMGDC